MIMPNSEIVNAGDFPSVPSCQEIIRRIQEMDGISDVVKRDLKSAVVRVVSTWMKRDLVTTPADLVLFREEMKQWSAARFGISEATLTTTRSQFKRALTVAHVVPASVRVLGPQWAALEQTLRHHWSSRSDGSDWLRMRLRSFMRWCERSKVAPEEMSDATISQFIDGEGGMRVRGNTSNREQRLREAWNRAVQELPGWPTSPVSPHRIEIEQRVTSIPEDEFPPSFIGELDQYQANGGFLHRMQGGASESLSHLEWVRMRRQVIQNHAEAGKSIASTKRRAKPLSPRTIYAHRRFVIMCATALVVIGLKRVEDIRSIADAVCAEGIAAIADQIEKRRNKTAPRTGHAAIVVKGLLSVASRCEIELPTEEWQTMRELAQSVCDQVETREGVMTPKNRRLLAQFDDPDNFAMLVSIPESEMRALEAERRKDWLVTDEQARRAAAAIGVLILCTLPVRRRTLGTTTWSNFRKPDRQGANATLMYDEAQTKNKKPLKAILEAGKWRLIELYWMNYRPILNGADRTDFLFPSMAATGHVSLQALAHAIIGLVRRHTGLIMTLHNFRHVMASKLARADREIDGAARALGHAPGSVATLHYTEAQTEWAIDKLGEITGVARERGMRLHVARIRRRKSKESQVTSVDDPVS